MTHYRIFPPYIDAYYDRDYDLDKNMDELKELMIQHAKEWGTQVIGESILSGKDVPRTNLDGKYILCCARATYQATRKEYDERIEFYAVVEPKDEWLGQGYWWENIEIIQGVVPFEWDVT